MINTTPWGTAYWVQANQVRSGPIIEWNADEDPSFCDACAGRMGQLPDPMSEAGHKPASLLSAILQCAFQIESELRGAT